MPCRAARLGFVLYLFIFISRPVIAQEGSFATGPATTDTVQAAPSAPDLVVSAGPGLVFYNGNYTRLYESGTLGWALNANVMARIAEQPLYAGLDFAFNFWSFDSRPIPGAAPVDDLTRTSIGIQVLPSLVYRFSIPDQPEIIPYLGFSIGPNFYIHRARIIDRPGAEVRTATETHLYLEILARPGVDYKVDRNVALNFEPKFGLLNWDFIFMPQANFVLTL